MIVLKFGGTSVQNTEMIDQALSIVKPQLDRSPVLVSSAMGKTTDKLVAIGTLAEQGKYEEAITLYTEIESHHLSSAEAFLTGANLAETLEKIKVLLQELKSVIKGLSLLCECSPRSSDTLLSFGELMSTTLISARANELGIPCEWKDSRKLVVTDNQFTSALPLFEPTYQRIQQELNPEPGKLIVLQGFIANTEDGATSTLGRGGSDFTATIVGGALGAEEVQIWTDVNGIMTTDPRVVSGARTVESITYNEAAELAFFGAKVVHPSTIQPAVRDEIPVLVKNTKDPDGICTRIIGRDESRGLKAIAGKKEITLINITSTRMLNAYGFLSRIFSIFEKYSTPVDLIATSEVSVSMTIENPASIAEITDELNGFGDVAVTEGKAILCLVGQDLWKDNAFVGQVFNALGDIPLEMITLGSSDINLSLVVDGDHINEAISRVHQAFF